MGVSSYSTSNGDSWGYHGDNWGNPTPQFPPQLLSVSSPSRLNSHHDSHHYQMSSYFFHIFYPYNSWWDPYNNRSQIRPSRRPYLYRAPGPCRTCLLSRLDHRPIGHPTGQNTFFIEEETVHCTFGGFQLVMGVPPNGWFIMGNPMKMDDDWGYPYFRKLPFLFIGMNMHMMMRQSYMCTMRCENPELWTDNTPAISSRWIICNWIYKALCIW